MWLMTLYCKALYEVKFSQIEGNGWKFSHIELSNWCHPLNFPTVYRHNCFLEGDWPDLCILFSATLGSSCCQWPFLCKAVQLYFTPYWGRGVRRKGQRCCGSGSIQIRIIFRIFCTKEWYLSVKNDIQDKCLVRICIGQVPINNIDQQTNE